uniref:YrdC-like domain-containing protein n=1 Tax=Romanomermis culicivorax TaxID=13658 RepID=A0A915KCN9_ROMCU
MRQTLPALPKERSAQGYGLPRSDSDIACCRSGFGTDSVVGFAIATTEIHDAGQHKPVNNTENAWPLQHNRTEGTPAPLACFIPKDCCPEFLRTPHLAKKYPHLPWALLKEPFEVEVLTAADVVLLAPAALGILGPDIPQRAIEFIADGTIQATPVDKILLDGEPSSPAVDAICRAVEEASRKPQPTAQPVANAFGEMLPAINDNISIIELSPFPTATALQSPKIGILCAVHLCGGLVIDFPGEDPVSSDDDDEE